DRSIDDGLEDRVEVEGRARDRLDHIADCRFALGGAPLLAPEHGQLAAKRRRIIHRSRDRAHRLTRLPPARQDQAARSVLPRQAFLRTPWERITSRCRRSRGIARNGAVRMSLLWRSLWKSNATSPAKITRPAIA